MHCIEGEDETFETCNHLYTEEATINCNERPKGRYDIRDMAIPCNNITECLNGMDEKCDENNWILVGFILAIVILTNIIYHYLKWYCLNWSHQNVTINNTNDEWSSRDCVSMMGDELADMKVSLHKKGANKFEIN